jgi:hypothetical protein
LCLRDFSFHEATTTTVMITTTNQQLTLFQLFTTGVCNNEEERATGRGRRTKRRTRRSAREALFATYAAPSWEKTETYSRAWARNGYARATPETTGTVQLQKAKLQQQPPQSGLGAAGSGQL